jgi:elongation factor Ts
MSITASDVKNLREKTGAGMMDCKKALMETGGDFEQAIDYLKKQGLAKAGKKGDRIAAEGLVFAKIAPERAVMVELNCETDFVAKNEDFLKAGAALADLFCKSNPASLEDALQLTIDGVSVEEKVNSLVAVIGEKITLRRFKTVTPKSGGRVGGYIHMGGKIVVLSEVTGANVTDEAIKDVSMQVAAMNPKYVDKSQVSQDEVQREKAIFVEQLKSEGKPAEILEKILQGKLDKFASEISLMQQVFVKDPSGKKTVAQFLKDLDPQSKVVQFERFAVGEGIEKRQENFAEEVAKMMH